MTEKQRKVLVEAIKNPKNSKKTLEEILGFGNPRIDRDYDRWKTRGPEDQWPEPEYISQDDFFEATRDGSYDEEFLKYVQEEEPELLGKIKAGIEDSGTAIGSAIDQKIYSWKEIAEIIFPDQTPVDYYNELDENVEKKFDYKEYLAEGWLHQEAGAKDAYLTRQKRAAKGNWKGSVGKYVEDHRAEIDAAAQRGHGELRAYMRSTMMPALGPEAQEYLEQLLTGYADDRRLHQALYNILLKGHGLGLHEDQELQLTSEFWKKVCLQNDYTPLEEPHPNKEYDNLSLQGKVRADSGTVGLFRVCSGNRPGYKRGWTFYTLAQSPGSGKTWTVRDSGSFKGDTAA